MNDAQLRARSKTKLIEMINKMKCCSNCRHGDKSVQFIASYPRACHTYKGFCFEEGFPNWKMGE